MNERNIFKNPCPVCKKREATQLCDFVIDYIWTTIDFKTESVTCDLPLCKECAYEVGVNVDLCPHHYRLYQQKELPEHLQKYQRRVFT